MNKWSIQDAREMYNIKHWSGGYFDINEQGNVVANPNRHHTSPNIDLYGLIDQIKNTGLSLPTLIRFPHILADRIDCLTQAFNSATLSQNYAGGYTAVYPIKVNQEQSVVSEIIQHGKGKVGLEAGSKPELMAVLALSNTEQGTIVCNGYKDREYIRLALIGQQLGYRLFIVLEKMSELDIIIEQAKALHITPLLGIRVRLDSISDGKWQNTGGEKAKFGLSASQVLQVIDRLKQVNLIDSLELLHFHLGSQIANIKDIQTGMSECARYYSELHKNGVSKLKYVDVGGGLAIDYDGTRSRNYFSLNYTVDEYANTIIDILKKVCKQSNITEPHIITESGRAMVAHHAVLVIEVIETEQSPNLALPAGRSIHLLDENLPDELIQLDHLLRDLNQNKQQAVECYLQAKQFIGDINQRFKSGTLNIQNKALAEQYFYALCNQVRERLNIATKSHRSILDELNEKLADKYFCNFSLFQSIPDVWAIEQIFPIMPLHRHQEKPNQRGTLNDITCDSDGRIDYYVDGDGIESSLPLHAVDTNAPYYLGVFLVGAYQEILGDMHNLFGDTNSVNVDLVDDAYKLGSIQRGDSIDYVLRHVHFDPAEFLTEYNNKLECAPITPEQYKLYFQELKAGLTGYTYLEE
ncbi:MAG: biosynthetic arginine decarboxylase [Gammaproteobacteria bacterium]|nr:biosynthetic arginine decarboxylase [Gammaproteobacteria bacterium]